ncbi:hypothetical protein CREGCYN_02850 [Synechococcus sp. M16CYN]
MTGQTVQTATQQLGGNQIIESGDYQRDLETAYVCKTSFEGCHDMPGWLYTHLRFMPRPN